MEQKALVTSLGDIVGSENVVVGKAREDYSRDMAEYGGIPSAVVIPHTEDEVAKIVAFAAEKLIPVLARGGGSSLTGAAVLNGGIIIDMRKMNKVIHVDTLNWHVRVQPGITLEELNMELGKQGFFFPPDPASSYVCTVGGAIAEGSGGLRCVKYGTMKDWVLALRVVLPNGKVTSLGEPLPKNRAGYDLVRLIVGSEGTLGIVTEAYLKIIPLPLSPPRRILATFDDWEPVGGVIAALRAARVIPGLFEFVDKDHIRAINERLDQHLDEAEATLIIDVDEAELPTATDVLKTHGAKTLKVAKDQEEAQALYEVRANAYLAVKSLAPSAQVEDVSVPLDKLGGYLLKVKDVASKHRLLIPVVGHAGDGNVHPVILYDGNDKVSAASAAEAYEEICRYAIGVGGSVSGEHGIGIQKAKLLREQLQSHDGAESLRLMKEIKRLLDPKGIMNPGKYVDAA
ncbi:MAG: FAD-binding protein [Nitrososphaerota archaeon]|nr:FAD-binding protein [Nitrososphaerota archaeon]MDG6918258.1 FAD-binding protein [Nitrososphaerota archaeon]